MILPALSFIALFTLLLLGVPIAFGMLVVGLMGFGTVVGWSPALSMLGQVASDTVLSYELSVVPLFILMGNFVAQAGLSRDLFRASNAFLGHYKGGLAMATILASGGFSAVCGSSVATAATMAKITIPPMREHRYSHSLAAGTVAAGGTLGILIPPSVPLVIYGAMTQTDVGKLFAAGIAPGLLLMLLYLASVVLYVRLRPQSGPASAPSEWRERRRSLASVWGVLLLFGLVMGGIYFGVFTPTEAAGIGAAGAFAFALLKGTLRPRNVVAILEETGRTTVILFFILIGAIVFANFLTVARAPNLLIEALNALKVGPLGFISIVVALFLILGCVLESLSMMLLLVPILYPAVASFGFDLIWFGILVVVLIEISLITPPIGLNIFTIRAMVPDVLLYEMFTGVTPFVLAGLLLVLMLIAAPQIALFLPSFMK